MCAISFCSHQPPLLSLQMKVTSRMTLRPLVDTLPCMGAVTVTLIEAPYIDFALHLFSRFDLMLLPGVREIANYFLMGVSLFDVLSACVALDPVRIANCPRLYSTYSIQKVDHPYT